ncbi:MAG TPA: hypothetical protein VFY90_14120 [Tepidiformaceae bacterium]|nr:hypothetical protein [Tepidiformaceae bacterium]
MSHKLLVRLLPLFLSPLPVGVMADPVNAEAFPSDIELPTGFQPEGIAAGRGHTFFVGSIPTGAIYKGDLRTGEGAILVPGQAGRAATGLKVDNLNRVFVSGAGTGDAWVYDGDTGADLAHYDFASAPTFINDVVVTNDGAYFTDSMNPVLYRVPIAPDGTLGAPSEVETISLSGDYQHIAGAFNLNGIDATPDGRTLVVVQSATGKLFTVDPQTGVTDEIDLGGESVPMGDGILLHGKILYVVQNRLNLVARIDLSPDLSSGAVVSRTGDLSFDIPTTVAKFGSDLYLVNARFGVANPGGEDFSVSRIRTP